MSIEDSKKKHFFISHRPADMCIFHIQSPAFVDENIPHMLVDAKLKPGPVFMTVCLVISGSDRNPPI